MAVKALVFDSISDEILKKAIPNIELTDLAGDPSTVFVRSRNLHQIPFPKSIAAICRAGAGTDNIPLDECAQRGIAVFNAPGANAQSVAEFAVGLMIDGLRGASRAAEILSHIAFANAEKNVPTDQQSIGMIKREFPGREMGGKTVLVIGMGEVGWRVAALCRHFHMNVLWYDPYVHVAREGCTKIEGLEKLPACDIVSFHVPGGEKTQEMFNGGFFSQLKRAFVINTARGEIIDEQALADALGNGCVEMYVSDFYSDFLFRKFVFDEGKRPEAVRFYPHLAASTAEAQERAVTMVAGSFKKFWETGEIAPRSSVNFPACELERAPDTVRFAVVNDNIPGMVAKIAEAVTSFGLNIVDERHPSRGTLAYGLYDLLRGPESNDSKLFQLFLTLQEVPGVKRVRIIL